MDAFEGLVLDFMKRMGNIKKLIAEIFDIDAKEYGRYKEKLENYKFHEKYEEAKNELEELIKFVRKQKKEVENGEKLLEALAEYRDFKNKKMSAIKSIDGFYEE